MALKITGAAPGQEKRPHAAQDKGNAHSVPRGSESKPLPPVSSDRDRPSLVLVAIFAAFVTAWIVFFAGLCYGVIRGVAYLATEPRGVQVMAAVFIGAGAFIFALAVIARGDQ